MNHAYETLRVEGDEGVLNSFDRASGAGSDRHRRCPDRCQDRFALGARVSTSEYERASVLIAASGSGEGIGSGQETLGVADIEGRGPVDDR